MPGVVIVLDVYVSPDCVILDPLDALGLVASSTIFTPATSVMVALIVLLGAQETGSCDADTVGGSLSMLVT
ncbi:hypothetical protein CE91St36_19390 [Christensenellaceae bacterium]|nr:hypothetical protein CE91St36_19390 [Christensenellaceae bacterium]